MSDNVVDLPVNTTLPIDPNKVLNGAIDKVELCMVIGYDKDKELYAASSISDKAELLYLIKQVEFKLLNGDY